MVILDKLIEKKDLRLYILTRIKRLKLTMEDEVMNAPEKRREYIKERFHGRILELQHLLLNLESNQIKSKSKINWEKVGGLDFNNIELLPRYCPDCDGRLMFAQTSVVNGEKTFMIHCANKKCNRSSHKPVYKVKIND